MTKNFKIENCNNLSEHENEIIIQGLRKFAKEAKDLLPINSYAIKITEAEQLIAAISGFIIYGCLYIDLLFVNENLRHQGLGSKLMNLALEKALENNCSFMLVTTMDWEAKDFYLKHGYVIEYERHGYTKGSIMYVFRKNL